MADKKKTEVLYQATARFFDWIPKDSGDFDQYYEMLKKGEKSDLKAISSKRLEWALINELIKQGE